MEVFGLTAKEVAENYESFRIMRERAFARMLAEEAEEERLLKERFGKI